MGSQKDSDATEDAHLCLWCHIQEFIAKSSVMEHFFYVFFRFGALCLGLNPFWINFCTCYKVRVQFYYFACGYPHAAGISTCCWDIQFSQQHLLKNSSFPTEWSWHPCWKSFNYMCKGSFLGSLFHWFVSIVPQHFDYSTFVKCIEIKMCETSNFLLFQDLFFQFRFLWGSMWILGWIFFLNFCKKVIGILIEIVLNL